ncbi:glycosyltransferase family A protein [Desulfobacter postgatei]|uniref:Glycosyl transferase n=1 Tax=Desulfobacter postgatei 2ac9 TaxID=879212 RepID=I5B262_9BACT|nr:glycosyltransferase family A protein [Desulfobacter postgatei]EIM63575.1 glycosyl transferase [Desulfobacter postgatei 2ac9]
MRSQKISVIIPTLAEKKRVTSVKRCVQSVRKSSTSDIKIIAVVNGNRFDKELCSWLKSQKDITFNYVAKPSLPNAILKGREMVKTPFFSIIDDDDEFLPNAMDTRLTLIEDNAQVDLVVCNGYVNRGQIDKLAFNNLEDVEKDPLKNLLESNWLASCGALFRSDSFTPVFFTDYHTFAEWTWIAFKIAMEKKNIAILDEPTFRINDTPESLSKSLEYKAAYFDLFLRMLEKKPPHEIIKKIKMKMCSAYHAKSVSQLKAGKYRDAVILHFKSIFLPGGLRYLTYSRKFLTPWRFWNQSQ